jgi:acyl carrier protein
VSTKFSEPRVSQREVLLPSTECVCHIGAIDRFFRGIDRAVSRWHNIPFCCQQFQAPNLAFYLQLNAQGPSMKRRIHKIVQENAGLGPVSESLDDSTDLYQAGMTSYASVILMIALENEFDLEFPDGMLSRSVFESVDSIANAIESLQQVRQ